MRAAYCTLGCKVNKYETDAMTEILEVAGYKTVEFDEYADVYIINTCTVTAVADRKSRQMIGRAVEKGGLVCVCGCLTQRDAQSILDREGVDAVLGSSGKSKILEVIRRLQAGETKINAVGDIRKERDFEPLQVSRSHERTRANIKICDGCNNFCSYCIIPYTRGPVRSRKPEDIMTEAKRLAASGVREVVLTGILVSSYGKDMQGVGFIDVLEGLQLIEGIDRIRLSSMEPTLLTEEFCTRAAALSKLCPHFHVSLQSGCTTVLKRMNRKYTAEQYAEYIANVRKAFSNPAITTDVIAGFQGETEEEHAQTMAFLQKVGFAKLHVFPYSKREGTAAARMPGDLTGDVKKQRAAEIIALGEKMSHAYAQSLIGTEHAVLLEQYCAEGICEGYIERYLHTEIPGIPGEIKRVRICGTEGEKLLCDVID